MGLFDSILKGTGNPEQDAAISRGLLQAGLQLMQARGKLFPALGQAGMAGVQATDQYRQQQLMQQRAALQEKMLRGQVDQQERQARIDALSGKFYRAPSQTGIDATGGMETSTDLPSNQGGPGGYNQQGWLDAYRAEAGPVAARQAELALMKPAAQPIKLGEGEQLLDPNTLRPLATNAKPPQQSSDYKDWLAEVGAGRTKLGYTEWAMAMKRAGATKVQIDAGQRQENAFATGQGKEFSDLMGGINKQSFTAPAQIRKLERLEQLLEGVDGGRLAPLGLEVASAANALGIKIDPKLGNKEAAQALSREIAGGFRQPGTGPMTDKDFENFLLQVPDLSKTAAGRKQITQTMKAALARDIALGKLAREYIAKNGQLNNGFLDEASAFIAENPVVGVPQGWKVER